MLGQDRDQRNCLLGQNSNQVKEDTEQSIEKTWEQSLHTGSGCQTYSNEEIRPRVLVLMLTTRVTDTDLVVGGMFYVVDKTSVSILNCCYYINYQL